LYFEENSLFAIPVDGERRRSSYSKHRLDRSSGGHRAWPGVLGAEVILPMVASPPTARTSKRTRPLETVRESNARPAENQNPSRKRGFAASRDFARVPISAMREGADIARFAEE
jgi:hypothetical protein